jgi:hypothetical protein
MIHKIIIIQAEKGNPVLYPYTENVGITFIISMHSTGLQVKRVLG